MRGLSALVAILGGMGCATKPSPPGGLVIASDQNVSGLALDASYLYWTTLDGSVMKFALAGSSDLVALVSGIASRPSSIAIDADFVYWTNLDSLNSTTDGGVMKVPVTGGAPEPLATSQYDTSAIAVSVNAVFWASNGALRSAPKTGGSITTLYDNGGFLVGVNAITLDTSNVYWTVGGPEKMPLTGGKPVGLSTGGAEGPGSIAVDATNVYWTVGPNPCDVNPPCSSHQGSVMKAPLAGGASTTLAQFETPPYPVTQIAVDTDYVYWTTAHELQRTSIDGGAIETLAANEGDPHAMVLGPNDVYWACGPVDGGPASIRQIAK